MSKEVLMETKLQEVSWVVVRINQRGKGELLLDLLSEKTALDVMRTWSQDAYHSDCSYVVDSYCSEAERKELKKRWRVVRDWFFRVEE